MSNNVFKDCKTASDVMKMMFSISAEGKYSREDIMKMANERRKEIELTTVQVEDDFKISKISIPTPVYDVNESGVSLWRMSQDFMVSDNITLLGNSVVAF